MTSSPNRATVPVLTYDYLFYLPPSEWPRSPAQQKARGLLSGSCTPGIMGYWLQPKILDTARFPPVKMAGEPCTHTRYGPTNPTLRGGTTNLKKN
jgi:hypothetical protein